MPKFYNWDDMKRIVYGGTFLAGGGGGGLDGGLAILDGLRRRYPDYKLPVLASDEIRDDQNGAVFGGIGAPSAVNPDTIIDVMDQLLRQGYNVASKIVAPKKIDVVIPSEQGALTFMMAVLPCIVQSIPMVDADGCDRAVPGLDCCLYTLNGIPFYPGVLTTPQGHVIRVEPNKPLDAAIIEKVCRRTLSLFENIMGMVCWFSSKSEIKNSLAAGTISKAYETGNAIIKAKEAGGVEEAINKAVPVRLLGEGKIVERNLKIMEGHDVGTTVIEADNGKRYYIDAVNESMLIRDDKKVIMTCPDVICCINANTLEPLSTGDTKIGQNVKYFGTPVDPQWFRNGNEAVFSEFFKKCGYEGGIVRY